jgi:hypothetical protein
MRVSPKISGFVTVELVDIIATFLRTCSILKRSKSITVGNGKSIMATKFRSQKFQVIQLDGSELSME